VNKKEEFTEEVSEEYDELREEHYDSLKVKSIPHLTSVLIASHDSLIISFYSYHTRVMYGMI